MLQILAAFAAKAVIWQGVSLGARWIGYLTMIPVFVAAFKYPLQQLDALIVSSPIEIQQAYYLFGAGTIVSMGVAAVTAGITARIIGIPLKAATDAMRGW